MSEHPPGGKGKAGVEGRREGEHYGQNNMLVESVHFGDRNGWVCIPPLTAVLK